MVHTVYTQWVVLKKLNWLFEAKGPSELYLKIQSLFKGNTLLLYYKDNLINAVYGNKIAVYSENHTEHIYTKNADLLMQKQIVCVVTTGV